MFDSLKKNKTLRSLLAASALFGAGTLGAKAAEADNPSTKKEVQMTAEDPLSARLNLMEGYRILTEALEDNLCYCYSDKGVPACGSGVHFKDFRELKETEVLKVTFKKGHMVNLEDKAYLQKLADTVSKNPQSVKQFDDVLTARKVKFKEVTGPFPKGNRKRWAQSLFLIPSSTLERVNRLAAETKVETALRIHPNLLDLPLLAQFVPVDLIYTMGATGYKEGFGEFQKAVASGNLLMMMQQCGTYNDLRRTAVKQALLELAILMRNNPHLRQEECVKIFQNYVRVKHSDLLEKHNPALPGNKGNKKVRPVVPFDSKLIPALEPALFKGLERVVLKGWRSQQGLTNNGADLYRRKYLEKKQK